MTAGGGSLVESTGTFQTRDGLDLFWVSRRDPSVESQRLVMTIHGFADHSGRISYLVEHLAARGAVVFSYDQRGNGRSPGRRGHIDAYRDLGEDLDAFMSVATSAHPGLQRVLFGHSTGGILAMAFAADHPDRMDRLVISAPALVLKFRAPAWKDAVARVMAKLVPTLTMQAGFPPESVSRDAVVVAANKADPLVVQDMSSRFYDEVYLKAAPYAMTRVADIKVPFLLIQGTGDLLVDPSVADEVERHATVSHQVRRYDGAYHETFNDTAREEVFADIDAWLDAPIP